ncbi:hypothetical protein BJ742DRAFT_825337, partial [Cladochytrium replicatum]
MGTRSECSVLDLLSKSECIRDGSVAFDASLLPSSVLQVLPSSFLSNGFSMLENSRTTAKQRRNDIIEVAPPFRPDWSSRNNGQWSEAASSSLLLNRKDKHIEDTNLQPRSEIEDSWKAKSGQPVIQKKYQAEQESQKAFHFHNCHFHLAENDTPHTKDEDRTSEQKDNELPIDGNVLEPRSENESRNVLSKHTDRSTCVQEREMEEILLSVNAILDSETGSAESTIDKPPHISKVSRSRHGRLNMILNDVPKSNGDCHTAKPERSILPLVDDPHPEFLSAIKADSSNPSRGSVQMSRRKYRQESGFLTSSEQCHILGANFTPSRHEERPFRSKRQAIEGAWKELDLMQQELKRKSDELSIRERKLLQAEQRIASEVENLASYSIEEQRAEVQMTVAKCEQATVEVLKENRRLQTSLKSLVDANRALRSKVVALEAEAKLRVEKLDESFITTKRQNERIERLRSKLAVAGVKPETQQPKGVQKRIGPEWTCAKCNNTGVKEESQKMRKMVHQPQAERQSIFPRHIPSVSCSTQTEYDSSQANESSSMIDQCTSLITFLIGWALNGRSNSSVHLDRPIFQVAVSLLNFVISTSWPSTSGKHQAKRKSPRLASIPDSAGAILQLCVEMLGGGELRLTKREQQNLQRATTEWKNCFYGRDSFQSDRIRLCTLADLLVLNASDDNGILESTLHTLLAGLADEEAKHEFLYSHGAHALCPLLCFSNSERSDGEYRESISVPLLASSVLLVFCSQDDPSLSQFIESCTTPRMLSSLEVAFCHSIHMLTTSRNCEESETFLLATNFAENLSILWQKFSRLETIKSYASNLPGLTACLKTLVLEDVCPSDFLVINAKSISDNLCTTKS